MTTIEQAGKIQREIKKMIDGIDEFMGDTFDEHYSVSGYGEDIFMTVIKPVWDKIREIEHSRGASK